MASNNETKRQLNRFMLPHEIFRSTIPNLEEHKHKDDDNVSDFSSWDDDSDLFSLDDISVSDFASWDSSLLDEDSIISDSEYDGHEHDETDSDGYTPSLDDSVASRHHQHHDEHESHGLYGPFSPPPRSASPFDCNMCLKMAREPVVTSCCHLYCWPCLYWLYCYSNQSECLVCKTKVFDSLIIPIHSPSETTSMSNRDTNFAFNGPPRAEAEHIRD